MLRFYIMNDKKGVIMLLKILDQIRQDNEEARNGIERRSITTICKEDGISFEQVFISLFLYLFIYLFILNRYIYIYIYLMLH